MASGSFQSNTGVTCNIRVEWTSTANVSANTSTVNVKVYLVHNALSVASRTLNINCLGSTYSVATPAINTSAAGNKTLLADKSFTIAHNADGTKSGTISATIKSFGVTYGGTYIGDLTTSGTATLDTIPRATQPTVSASSVDMGSNITISMPRASGSFTHTLKYKFGNASGTIGESLGTSKTWTVPLSLANQIPSATSGTCTITCETWNTGTKIGTKTVTFTAKVPSSVVPTISTVATSDPNGYLSTYGGYVQNKSKCKANVTASGTYGSTITAYSIVMNGSTYTSKESTSGVLTTSGSNTIKATVTDSRGRTATKSVTITVLAYTSPTISKLKVIRCNSDGNANEEGSYFKATMVASITDLNENNSKTFTLQYKLKSASSWTTAATYTSDYSLNTTKRVAISTESSYDIRLVATDAFSSSTKATDIAAAFTLMDLNSSGKGIAFGKVSESDKFECNMDTSFKNVKTTSGADVDTMNTNLSSVMTKASNIGSLHVTSFYYGTSATTVTLPLPTSSQGRRIICVFDQKGIITLNVTNSSLIGYSAPSGVTVTYSSGKFTFSGLTWYDNVLVLYNY